MLSSSMVLTTIWRGLNHLFAWVLGNECNTLLNVLRTDRLVRMLQVEWEEWSEGIASLSE
jgi:hypothetical protein